MNTATLSSRSDNTVGTIVTSMLLTAVYTVGLMFVGWVIGSLLDRSPLGTHLAVLLTFGALLGWRREPGKSNIRTWKSTLLDAFFLAIIAAVLSLILLNVPFTSSGAGAFASTYGGGMPFPLTAAIVTFVYTAGIWLYDCVWGAVTDKRA